VNPPNPFEFPQLEIERNQRKEAAEAKRRLTRFHRLRDAIEQLAEIIAEKGFFVSGGALLFYVVPKDSRVEQEFIHEQRRPMVYS